MNLCVRFAGRVLGLAMLLGGLAVGPVRAGDECASVHDLNLPRSGLAIDTEQGTVVLAVEIAATDASREQGLMCRRQLPPGAGMLFDMQKSEIISMWMKNTLIPLDMVFIDDKGVIQQVAANARPMSLAIIQSDGPVRAVLELNAGAAAAYHLKRGDHVRHRLFGSVH